MPKRLKKIKILLNFTECPRTQLKAEQGYNSIDHIYYKTELEKKLSHVS